MQLKEVETFSASSVSTYLDCQRKWWFKYVLGIRVPPSKAMKHGTGVHKDIEGYYLEETPLTTPEAVELHANGYMPERELVTGVEFNASELGLELEGLRLLGYIDLIAIDPETGEERIIDWKTRSSFSYAPGTAELEQDIAGRIYAWTFFERTIHQSSVNFEHGNMLRVDGKKNKTPRSMLQSCDYDREEIYRWVGGPLASTLREMRRTAQITDPREIPQSTDACYKYGPCEYKDRPMGPLRGRSCYDLPFAVTNPQVRQGEKMSLLKLAKGQKKDEPKEETSAPAPEKTEAPKVQPEPARTEDTTNYDALELAKAEFAEGKNQFDLQSYGLSPQQLREFVGWRNAFTKAEQEKQAENPIPAVNPPDVAPDETPIDLEDQEIKDFDFESVPGIGPKSGAALREYIAEKKITRLVQVLDLDLKKNVDGIGPKGQDALRDAIKAQKNWKPEGAEEPETPTEQPSQPELLAQAKELVNTGKAFERPGVRTVALDVLFARMDDHTTQQFLHWHSAKPASVDQGTGSAPLSGDGALDAMIKVATEHPSERAPSILNVLYIDCYPIQGVETAVSLDDLLRPLKAQLAKDEGVRYWSADKYGKGRKILVSMVLEDPAFLQVGHVVALSGREGMEQLLPEIEQFFDLVVVGPGR